MQKAALALRELFGAKQKDISQQREPGPVLAEQAAGPRDIIRTVSGRIVRLDARQLVAEFSVTHEPLDWQRPSFVELLWADGSRVRAEVKQGTRSGRVAPGVVMRLVVELAGLGLPPGDPAAIHISTGEGVLAVELE